MTTAATVKEQSNMKQCVCLSVATAVLWSSFIAWLKEWQTVLGKTLIPPNSVQSRSNAICGINETSRTGKNRIKERERERERDKWRSQIACPYVRSVVANPKSGPDYSVFIVNTPKSPDRLLEGSSGPIRMNRIVHGGRQRETTAGKFSHDNLWLRASRVTTLRNEYKRLGIIMK
jgi:hypothetical protein